MLFGDGLYAALGQVTSLVAGLFSVEKSVEFAKQRLPHVFRPDNHDFYLGLRTAQLQASLCVLKQWADEVPLEAQEHAQFHDSVRAYLNGDLWLSVTRSVTDRLSRAAIKELALLNAVPMLGSDTHRTHQRGLAGDRQALEERVGAAARATLAEFAEHAGHAEAGGKLAIPQSFEAMFCRVDDSEPCWYFWFRLFLGEQIKANPRYFRIQIATRAEEIREGIVALENDLAAFREAVLARLEPREIVRRQIAVVLEAMAPAIAAQERKAQQRHHALQIEIQQLAHGIYELRLDLEHFCCSFERYDERLRALLTAKNCTLRLRLPDETVDTTGFARLVYRAAHDKFVGRDDAIRQLSYGLLQLDQPAAERSLFSYGLLHGPAGAGKSRLALELMRYCRADYPLGGFVVDDQDGTSAVAPSRVTSWEQTDAAFIAIDYASTLLTDDLIGFLRALRAAAERSGKATRVLLIDRSADGEWYEHLKAMLDVADPAMASMRQPDTLVDALDDTALIAVMRGRLGPEGAAYGDDELLQICTAFDERRRPLFAAMLGEWLAEHRSAPLDPDAILRALLIREERQVWLAGVDERTETGRLRAEKIRNTLCLATMCRGLRLDGRWPILDPALSFIRFAEEFEEAERFDAIVPRAAGAEHCGFLEPDLIGESFVLMRLESSAGRREKLLAQAWALGGWELPGFVLRCFEDFPDKVRRLGFLLPEPGKHQDRVVALCRTLIYSCHQIAVVDHNATRQMAETAAEIFGLLRGIAATVPAEGNALRDVAAALGMTQRVVARHLNPKIVEGLTGAAPSRHIALRLRSPLRSYDASRHFNLNGRRS